MAWYWIAFKRDQGHKHVTDNQSIESEVKSDFRVTVLTVQMEVHWDAWPHSASAAALTLLYDASMRDFTAINDVTRWN